MFIEMLDYGVTIDSHETVNYFRNFPDRGSIGYFSFEDAEADRNPLGNVEKYLDIVGDFISAGLIGDHYVFSNGQVSEIISEYEGWDWTPETGIVPWESSEPEPENRPNRKSRRAVRIEQNKSRKGSDRAHGKKRMPSAKFVREADGQDVFHAHAKYVWHENHKGEWIPRTVRKHDKFRKERFVPSPDWDGEPDPLMPAERLERNQKIEQLKNQLDVLDWEMEDVTDRIQLCREDLQEIEWHKNREAEVRQSLKEWQDRLATLSRQYNDLTERIMNLA